jgi:hypothetical protein
MKKITRTFRIPADLVERFDRAVELAGVDKTLVVESAILDFCERVEAGETPTFRKETKRMKDVRKFEHADRVEYYSNSLFDIAEVIDATDRDEFIEKGKKEFDRVKPVYGIKEFLVTVYQDGRVTGEMVTNNEVLKEFYTK